MEYSLRTSHIELAEADTKQLDAKLNRLKKIINPPYTCDIVFEHSTHHQKGDVVECTITLENGGRVFHAEKVNDTVQTALDDAITAIRREITKRKEKSSTHTRIRPL